MGYHGRLEATYSSAVSFKESMEAIMLSTILVIVLILILLGALPTWPYSAGWGYGQVASLV